MAAERFDITPALDTDAAAGNDVGVAAGNVVGAATGSGTGAAAGDVGYKKNKENIMTDFPQSAAVTPSLNEETTLNNNNIPCTVSGVLQ